MKYIFPLSFYARPLMQQIQLKNIFSIACKYTILERNIGIVFFCDKYHTAYYTGSLTRLSPEVKITTLFD